MPKPPSPNLFSEQLIPWYVNGTLSEHEMDRVNTQVNASPALTESVNKEMRLTKLLRETSPDVSDLLGQKDRAFEQLLNKVHTRKNALPQRRVWYACAASLLVMVMVLATGAYRALLPQATMPGLNSGVMDYQTLTNAPAYTGTVLQVIFKPSITERQLEELLIENGMRILSGPTQQGVYRIALPPDAESKQYAQLLKKHNTVLWVGIEAR